MVTLITFHISLSMMMLQWKGKQLSQEILNNIQLVTTVHEWHACFSLFCYDECQNLNLTLTSKAHIITGLYYLTVRNITNFTQE